MGVALAAALTLDAPGGAAVLAPFQAAALRIEHMVAIQPAAGVTPVPSASPSPNGTPTPHAYAPSRGYLQFSLTGSLSMGERQSSQTQTIGGFPVFGPSPSASPSPATVSQITTSQNQALSNVGMLADIQRRSAYSSFDLKLPVGFATNSRIGFGQVSALYATAHYGLGYGPQTVSVFGQLLLGSTLRGEYLILPETSGDLTLIAGPTIGAQSEQIPMEALRWRHFSGRDLYEVGLMKADGRLTGRSQTLLVGAATSRGNVTAIAEAAVQDRTGGDISPHGITYQGRLDDGSLNSYFTAISRHIAPGTVEYGSGEYYGENFWDLGIHENRQLQSFSFDTSKDILQSPLLGGGSMTRVSSLNYGGPFFRAGSYTITLQSTGTSSTGGPTQWNGLGNLQLSSQVGNGELLLASTVQRLTQSLGGNDSSQVGLSANFQQPLRSIFASVGITSYRQTTQAFGASNQTTETIGLTKNFLRTNYGIQETFTHTSGALSNALSRSTQFSVTRQISPVFNVQANYLISSIKDRLNPAANNKTHTFSLQLNAPFAFGNGVVSGAIDPHLPATIVGRVLTDTTSNPTFAGLISSGVSNVQIVLDDKTVQRTDVSGGFQFSFVTPGQHQLRIETASLPRGVTVDIPVYTLNVDGGQTAQVSFLVGDFGGIKGHVYGTNGEGQTVPLANVAVRVDGGTYSHTDLTGAYGFGRLRPGKHKVTVIESTVPAFATIDPKKATADVDVKNGVFTTLNFSAEPLGSISGTILFDNDEGPNSGKPVPNAYVVAEPGEHAAIVDDSGSFIVDDLPPGDYTLSVDNETVPEGLGAAPDSIAVHLGPQEHYKGAAFLVGHTEKKVVFSFIGGSTPSAPALPKVSVSERRLPPRGTATVSVDAPASAKSVEIEVFDRAFSLRYLARSKTWVGTLEVPTNVKAGTYEVRAKDGSGTQPRGAKLTVDPKMPLVIMHLEPANPQPGQYVRVRARFLVDVRPGDQIQWADGQITVLGKPVAGRVFTFNLRISLRPLHGVLLTKGTRLPISLM